ncbi:MAG: hypothetical protein AAFV25_01735 [Bacteroidota bacterium]
MTEHTNEPTKWGKWMMAGLLFVLVFLRFFPLTLTPNTYFLGDSQDGFRSLLTTEYHILHDSTYRHFAGMNHPYGDAIHFAGAQPLTTNALKWISTHIVDVSPYTTGIIHYLLFISYFFSGWLMFLLLRKLSLPDWYAILVALGITFLAPQNGRFSSHYDLAYTFVLPTLLYQLYCFEKNRHWMRSLLMGIGLLILSQIQSYLFALCVFFLAGYFGLTILFNLRNGRWTSYLGHAFLQLVLPMGLFLVWMKSVDTLTDRCAQPYGFFTYISYWHTVFFSPELWSGKWTKQFIPAGTWVTGEGWAYIGLAATTFLFKESIWQGIRSCRAIWQRKSLQWYPDCPELHRRYLSTIFGTAVALLLLSMGIPFVFEPFAFLADYIGPLRQFRSLGRFAWAFYYCSNVVVFYLLYHQIRSWDKPKWRWGLLALFVGLLLVESIVFTARRHVALYPRPEWRESFRKEDNAWLDSINVAKYQAILPLPYYHVGSENIWLEPAGKILQRTFWPSVQTGLPSMGVFLGRTSLSQTIHHLAFIGEPYRRPQLLDDLPNDKDILVIVEKAEYKRRWHRFDHLLYGLEPLHETPWLKIYALPPALIDERVEQQKEKVQAAFAKTQHYPVDGLLSADSLPNFIYRSFDQSPNERSYRGGGSWQGPGANSNIVFDGSIPNQKANFLYVYSAWHYIREDLHLKTLISMREYDPVSGKEIQKKQFRMANYIRSVDGDWAISDLPLRFKRADSHIQLILQNNSLKDQPIFMDELQLRSHKALLFKEAEGELARNNRWFPLADDPLSE